MNVDSYYEIGTSHIVCEDHAIHGEYEGLYYVIGADGCSSSAGVDLGSGLLCHIAKKQIMQLHKTVRLFDNSGHINDVEKVLKSAIVQNCLDIKSSLKLGPYIFDATLWIIVVYQRRVFVLGWGDGAIIVKSKGDVFVYEKTVEPVLKGDGVFVVERKYDSNAPYYLSYKMDFQRDQEYHNMEPNGILRLNEFNYANNKQTDVKILNVDVPYVHEIDLDRVEMKSITICSDGIETYEALNVPPTKIDICNIASDFVDYKSLVGSFVERRMLKLRKTFKEKNIVHLDDIFCATINMEDV